MYSIFPSLRHVHVGISLTAHEELKKDNIIVSVIYPYITDTNFYMNRMTSGKSRNVCDEDNGLPNADSPEYVAEKILEGITSEEAEIFAHDWMRER